MQLCKGENLIKHEDEIRSRPERTWLETLREMELRGKVSKAQLNGLELPEKKVKLSNKKKKLEVMKRRLTKGDFIRRQRRIGLPRETAKGRAGRSLRRRY